MSDFDDLRLERLRREEEARQQAQQDRRKEEQKQQLIAERNARQEAATNKFDSIVRNVLEDLGRAVNPDWKVRHWSFEWALGYEYWDSSNEFYSGLSWRSEFRVSLKFDTNGNPVNFVCEAKGNSFDVNLSRNDLVATLRKLHTTQTQPQERKTGSIGAATGITVVLLALALPSIGFLGVFALLMFGQMLGDDPFTGALIIIAVIIGIVWLLAYGITKLFG